MAAGKWSFEKSRSQAYSEDMRWRMVYQNKFLGRNYQQIAECLNVDPSTVCRIIQLFDETGTVKKRDYPENFGTKKLGDIEKLLILQIVIEKPGIYLEEIAGKLQEETGTEVSKTTICRFLHKSSFTRQKMVIAAQQRCDFLRSKYLLEISVYSGHPEFFIFIDETGADRRDSMRKFAYSLRGKPAMVTKLLKRGQCVSAIVGMSHNGIIDFYTTLSTVNSDSFLKFVQNCLIPVLKPFNGVNEHSIVVLDNAAIHHVDNVVDAIQSTGALVQFLPLYSPDMNPIENAFSYVKSLLKNCEDTWKDLDTETKVTAALCSISKEDCQAWISHCGYH